MLNSLLSATAVQSSENQETRGLLYSGYGYVMGIISVAGGFHQSATYLRQRQLRLSFPKSNQH